MSYDDAEVIAAIRAYLTAADWDEARKIIEERERVLLSPEADVMFAQIVSLNQPDPRAEETLRTHHQVLRWCHEDGIEAAFRRVKGGL
ncbi:MAG: hypothetical protein JXB47_08610 [Anaerolineae bacterium]|nr:hypothetical protein [Anaerolineae bacterium]